MTAAGITAAMTGPLRTRPPARSRSEHVCEIVAAAYDRDGDPSGGQTEQPRTRHARREATPEARRLDQDHRCAAPSRQQEPIHGPRAESGDDDEQLARPLHRGVLEQSLEWQLAVGLDSRQRGESAVPVTVEGGHPDELRLPCAEDEGGPASAPDERTKEPTGGANLSVEARVAARPDDGGAVALQQDDDVVVWGLTQLP